MREIPLALLEDYPDRRVFGDGDLSGLVESIREVGLLQPLVVEPVGNRYRVVAGHRRRDAARLAGLETVPCVVLPGEADPLAAFVQSNTTVRQLSPMDLARVVRLWRERVGIRRGRPTRGQKKPNGSAIFGLSPDMLRVYDRLNDLVPELQDAVDRGCVPVSVASRLASEPEAVQRAAAFLLAEGTGLDKEKLTAGILLEVMHRKISELEDEVALRKKTEGEIEDLERRLRELRDRKRDLEYDIVDRQNALRVVRERVVRSGALLLSLVDKVARPVAAARPEIESLLERPLDGPTAANLLRWANVLLEVGDILRRAATSKLEELAREDLTEGKGAG